MIKEKKTPGLAASNMTGTGPGGLSPRKFAEWYRDLEIQKWQVLDLDAIDAIAKALEKAEKKGKAGVRDGQRRLRRNRIPYRHRLVQDRRTGRQAADPLHVPQRQRAFMTAIGNDLGYDHVFSRQLQNLLQRGDVVVIISGSGNSPNVIKAAEYAKEKGATTIGMTGFSGGKLRKMVDICLHIDSDQYGVIEDLHMAAGSILAFYLKQRK
jgi:phosphoheptose isomerase